jgi:hypothetical protein
VLDGRSETFRTSGGKAASAKLAEGVIGGKAASANLAGEVIFSSRFPARLRRRF